MIKMNNKYKIFDSVVRNFRNKLVHNSIDFKRLYNIIYSTDRINNTIDYQIIAWYINILAEYINLDITGDDILNICEYVYNFIDFNE